MMLRNGKRMSHSDRDFIINNGHIEQAVPLNRYFPRSEPSISMTSSHHSPPSSSSVHYLDLQNCVDFTRGSLVGRDEECVEKTSAAQWLLSAIRVSPLPVTIFLFANILWILLWIARNHTTPQVV